VVEDRVKLRDFNFRLAKMQLMTSGMCSEVRKWIGTCRQSEAVVETRVSSERFVKLDSRA